MELLAWDEQYSVGVHELDHQHQKLFDILNRIYDCVLTQQSQNEIGLLAEKLEKTTLQHFLAEEALMARAGYPGLDAHREQHAVLLRQIERFTRFYKSGDIELSEEVLDFLRIWLSQHILEEDSEYKPWVEKQAAQAADVAGQV